MGGDPDDDAVVLLHGGGLSSGEWTDIEPRLAAGRRVVSFDAGLRRSDLDPQRRYGVRTIADDLGRVREALGLPSFVLVGHSFGAVTACLYAAEIPRSSRPRPHRRGPANHTRPASLGPPLTFATRAAAAAALRSLPNGFPDWYRRALHDASRRGADVAQRYGGESQ